MSLHEKHTYESNLLAFKLACILQVFELMATVLYRADRVGWLNTTFMVAAHVVIAALYVFFFAKYGRVEMGKYLMMGCMYVG